MLWFDALRSDLKYASKNLARTPGFTAMVVVVMGAAIGLNATLFTVLAGITLRPWGGLTDPARVVRVYLKDASGPAAGFSLTDAATLDSKSASLRGVAAMRSEQVRLGASERGATQALMVSGNFFEVLGVPSALGRLLTPTDDRAGGAAAVAVLGYTFWHARFGGDAAVVGQIVRINDVPFRIAGVVASAFEDSEPAYDVQIYLPFNALLLLKPGDPQARSVLTDPAACCSDVVARLRPGVSRAAAQAELDVLARGFTAFSGNQARGALAVSTTFIAQPGRADSAQALLTVTMLGGALVLVWLIACANTGNLLLARSAARLREMGTRLALGASRRRLLGQLLTESLVLAALAGAAGVGIAYELPFAVFRLVADSGTPARFPFSVSPDASVLAYVALLGGLSVAGFALAPALVVTRAAMHSSMIGREGVLGQRLRLRSILLAVQVAVSVVLLVSAGLLVRGAQRLAATFDPGFDVENVDVLTLSLPERAYDRARTTALFGEIAGVVGRLPGVDAAFASREPFSLYRDRTMSRLPGESNDRAGQLQYVDVSPGYFSLLRIPLIAGRPFAAADTGQPYVIVNETMARRFWPGGEAVGKTFYMRVPGPTGVVVPRQIVAVARDVHTTMSAQAAPMFYRPVTPGAEVLDFVSSDPRASQAPVILLKGPRSTVTAIVAALVRLDGRIQVQITPLATSLESRLASARWGPLAAALLGTFALALAIVGMFGVFAYAVHQRRREIGVRMALGAQPSAVVWLVLAGHSRAVVLGLLVGLVGALAATAVLRSRLHGLSPFDPLAFVAVALILGCSGLVASYVPAKRATRISPIEALRPD